jgi:hypothetical protein
MITGFECYKYYLGIKLHFTSDKYDVIKAGGKVSAGQTAYAKRRDKYFFEKLAEKLDQPRYAIRYFVANFAYGHDNVVYDREVSQDLLTKWIKVKESLSKVFEDELEIIYNDSVKNKLSSKQVFYCTQNGICSIIKLWKAGKISIETVNLIMQYKPDAFEQWKEYPECKLVYANDLLRVEKLTPFVKVSDRCAQVWNSFMYDFADV